jgi:hypothetical protein
MSALTSVGMDVIQQGRRPGMAIVSAPDLRSWQRRNVGVRAQIWWHGKAAVGERIGACQWRAGPLCAPAWRRTPSRSRKWLQSMRFCSAELLARVAAEIGEQLHRPASEFLRRLQDSCPSDAAGLPAPFRQIEFGGTARRARGAMDTGNGGHTLRPSVIPKADSEPRWTRRTCARAKAPWAWTDRQRRIKRSAKYWHHFAKTPPVLATGGHGRVLLWDEAKLPGTIDGARRP